jgi:hypothetical protein
MTLGVARAADGTWTANADGLWSDMANWKDGVVASNAGSVVVFTNSTVDLTVTLPSDGVTVGRAEFRSTAGNNNWSFSGGPLTLDGPQCRLTMTKGTQRFYIPFVATNGFQKEPAGAGGTVQFLRSMTSTGIVQQLGGWLLSTPALVEAAVAEAPVFEDFFTVGALHLTSGSIRFDAAAGKGANVSTWTLSSGSPLVVAASNTNTSWLAAGQRVSGAGLPAGAFIRRIVNDTTFELNETALSDGQTSLAFAAYYPASFTRIDAINTDNNHIGAAAEIQVNNTGTQPMTVEVGQLQGGDNLRKTGNGTLTVRDLSAMNSSVRLDTGTLMVDNRNFVAAGPAAAPALHMDASAAGTLTVGAGNTVDEWRDVNGSNTAAVVSGMNAPTLRPDALNGLPAVDFGVFGHAGGSLGWAAPLFNIRAVFMVVGSQEKGGFLLGSHDTAGFTGIYDFHRGGPDDLQGTVASHPLAHSTVNIACAGFRNAILYIDGQRLSTTTAGFSGTYQMLEVMLTDHGRANAFCFDRVASRNRAGGQRLCEVILYTRALTDAERVQTQAYLGRKWFNRTLRAEPGSSEMHQVVAKASTPVNVQVSGGTRLTLDAVAGDRRVEIGGGGTLELKNAALSSASLVLRDGTLELPAAAGVPVPDHCPISNAFFHVDASADGTVMTDDVGRVLEWRDVRYSENGLCAKAPPPPATTAHYPEFRSQGLNGLPLVDCGALYSGKCLLWNHTNTNIRTVFVVYGSLVDDLSAFLIGDCGNPPVYGSTPHFHRGIDGSVWYNGAHSVFVNAPAFVNGRVIENGQKFVLPETPSVFSAVAADNSGTPTASAFAVDRWRPDNLTWRTGGSTLAEIVIFTNRLSYSERREVEAYLMRKWLDQPAPGYVLADGSRAGLSGLEVRATNTVALSVSGTGTVSVPDVSGLGDVYKTGEGTLLIGDTRNLDGTLHVREGRLRFGGHRPVPTAARLPAGLAFRLDASAVASLQTVEEGVSDYVTRADDADGRDFYAWAASAAERPVLIAQALNGKPVIDFGAYGSGRCLLWSNLISTVRSVFWVVGSQNGGGFLLGCDSRYGTGDDSAHFHRGDPFTGVLGRLWRSNASPAVRQGVTRLNGVAVNGEMTPLGGEFDLISLVTTGNTRASMFAGDRTFADRTGGQQLAEVLVFTRALSATEVRDVEAYLASKWFGRIPAGYEGSVPVATSLSTSGEGAIEVDADGLLAGGLDAAAEFNKLGEGVLTVGSLSTVTGRIDVVQGGLAVGGISYANAPVVSGLIYHIDPSRAETLQFDDDGSVTSIFSRVGSNVARRWPYEPSFKGPTLLDNALNGLPVLDFGSFGSKRFLELDQHVENVRSIFMVFGSQGGGGFLLGDRIANNDHRQFHRNNTGGWGVYTTPMFEGGYGDNSNIHTYGVTRQDGRIVNPRTTGFNGDYQIIEVHASSATHFQGHGFDRSRNATNLEVPDTNLAPRSGGQRLGEVLAYDRLLTAEERQQVYD